jgi:1-acyl-sn-glycerol-3-phosphate acyltransferase
MMNPLLYRTGQILIGLYARVMLDLDVQGLDELPGGAKIIAANHPSTTDPFLLVALIAEPVSILIHDTLFRVPLFGAYLRQVGHIRVVPGDGRPALEQARRQLAAGRSVVVFPEGGISPLEGGFHPPHSGVARLALASGAPVIPMGLHLPRERIRLVPTTVQGRPDVARWYLEGPYAVTVGRPLYFRGEVDDRARVRQVAAEVMQRIAALAHESARRMPARPILSCSAGLQDGRPRLVQLIGHPSPEDCGSLG